MPAVEGDPGAFAPWFRVTMVVCFVAILWIGVSGVRIFRHMRLREADDQHSDCWVASRNTSALLVGCSIAAA